MVLKLMKMNKIKSLNLKDFTKFKDTQGNIKFCEGINVFIGTNGTGKTHLLKLLYAISKLISTKQYNEIEIKKTFLRIFKTEKISNLISKYIPKEDYSIVNLSAFDNDFWIEISKNDTIQVSKFEDNGLNFNSMYIPPQEMLSTYYEFIQIFENYKTAYELIYYDFAKALSRLQPHKIDNNLLSISNFVSSKINGQLVKNKERFYIEYPYGKIEAPLVAEGIKKFSTIDYLIKNASLTKNTILFWDEPEAHINPHLLTSMTKVIKDLANQGIQIFISTHDHLLSQQISLLDEYRDLSLQKKEKIPEIKFFLLNDSDEGSKIESGSNLTDLQYNPILEEYINHHQKEQSLFNETL